MFLLGASVVIRLKKYVQTYQHYYKYFLYFVAKGSMHDCEYNFIQILIYQTESNLKMEEYYCFCYIIYLHIILVK